LIFLLRCRDQHIIPCFLQFCHNTLSNTQPLFSDACFSWLFDTSKVMALLSSETSRIKPNDSVASQTSWILRNAALRTSNHDHCRKFVMVFLWKVTNNAYCRGEDR
jgi:hypothetical protein